MSLRTSPQTGVAAQMSATKERYRCGVPLAGAIRSPFGTAPGDRNCSKGETDCHVRALPFLAMTVV